MRQYMPKVGTMGLDMMFRTCTVQARTWQAYPCAYYATLARAPRFFSTPVEPDAASAALHR